MTVMDEGRHHALGVNFLVARLELLTRENVDRRLLERQPLQPERHPHPERGNRPPESINLNTHRRPLVRRADTTIASQRSGVLPFPARHSVERIQYRVTHLD